ncbi:class II fructose-bisphosphate aldolase [Mycobacterium sp. WMMD1722]|uniref:class II fructose-bisphosphate aldolase n=1 Tax=Mycobacterium sp. WMMD1722 TaxID=3404117 RepID=UPI003BF61E06
MTLAATADLVAAATARGNAVPAFNVVAVEHAEGIAEGAERAGVAAVLQVSENTVRYHGGDLAPLVAACGHIATRSSVALSVHLDHFQNVELLTEGIACARDLGVTSVMVDAAHLPFRDNVERTRSFAALAHEQGLWVEAELGEIGGKGNPHAAGVRTDPDEAVAFAADTDIDGLAVAVGSTHAMTTRDASLDHELISRLASRLAVPLVLHGSSGVPDDQLSRAAGGGIAKINIGTALNVAYTAAVRRALSADSTATDPRIYQSAGRTAISDVVAALCRVVTACQPAAQTGQEHRP